MNKIKTSACTHPDLGRLNPDGDGWRARCRLPAFGSFRYGGRHLRRKRVLIPMNIGDDSETLPSSEDLVVAARIVRNQESLANKMRRAIWRDLLGHGPHTGMWWHGDLASIQENLASWDPKPKWLQLESADDLDRTLFVSAIIVGKEWDCDEDGLARIRLHAAYEEEHGVEVLTDGRSILGIGYDSHVDPFRE